MVSRTHLWEIRDESGNAQGAMLASEVQRGGRAALVVESVAARDGAPARAAWHAAAEARLVALRREAPMGFLRAAMEEEARRASAGAWADAIALEVADARLAAGLAHHPATRARVRAEGLPALVAALLRDAHTIAGRWEERGSAERPWAPEEEG